VGHQISRKRGQDVCFLPPDALLKFSVELKDKTESEERLYQRVSYLLI
jgi:hypothetical protein